jgi:hypothetical protein
MSRFPFAHEVDDLAVGDTVWWDDRPGWYARVVGLPTPETMDVDYIDPDNRVYDVDRNIERRMFTVTR